MYNVYVILGRRVYEPSVHCRIHCLMLTFQTALHRPVIWPWYLWCHGWVFFRLLQWGVACWYSVQIYCCNKAR